MAKFSETQGLERPQAELDFVDVDVDTDTRLYVDPYAIQIRGDEWSAECADQIRSYFNVLLQALREGNTERAEHLLSHLHEPNETFLGESSTEPRGRGVGDLKARQLAEALKNSVAFQTGVLSDIAEAELFIPGVGRDTISDLTTNILRANFATYTEAQCELLNIQTRPVRTLGPRWDATSQDWVSDEFQLPIAQERPVLLIPKFSVRLRMSLDSQEFYNHHMIEFLREEYSHGTTSLVQVLKDGRRHVTKKAVKGRHPFAKNDLAEFVRGHPEVLEEYKRIKGAKGPLDLEDFDKDFDERAFSDALIARLQRIPAGSNDASEYHSFCLGVMTFLFYPELTNPKKEHEIHQGRKRIDIKFTNAATSGFFHTMLASAQARAIHVFFECKNYSKDIANPELDQMSGRFGLARGFLGFVLCRSLDNVDLFVERCRDTALDGRGIIIHLTDDDLSRMLRAVSDGRRSNLDRMLEDKFDQLS